MAIREPRRSLTFVSLAALSTLAAAQAPPVPDAVAQSARTYITRQSLEAPIRFLSSVVVPGRAPRSISPCRTHTRSVSLPMPSSRAIRVTTPNRTPPCASTPSTTIRTARSFSSGGYRFDDDGPGLFLLPRSPDMTPYLPQVRSLQDR